MAKGALVFVVAAVVILMASVEKTEGAVACNDVTNELLACASFIVGTGPAPTAACCSGVQRLNSQAKTVADRRGVCGCLKSAASSYGVNFNKAAQLPSKCGVTLNVPISPTVDCSKVH